MTQIDEATARRRLTARYEEQVTRWPMMNLDVPLDLYIQRNLRNVMEHGLLRSYETETDNG